MNILENGTIKTVVGNDLLTWHLCPPGVHCLHISGDRIEPRSVHVVRCDHQTHNRALAEPRPRGRGCVSQLLRKTPKGFQLNITQPTFVTHCSVGHGGENSELKKKKTLTFMSS